MRNLLTIPLILLLCALVPAQQKSLLDELKGLEKFRSEKLGELKLYVSNKADVVRVMGKACQSICDLDANWKINFMYVSTWGMRKDDQFYRPKAETLGKLHGIKFFAKRSFKIDSVEDLPVGVTCRTSNGLHEAPSIKNEVCIDRAKMISFYIARETTSDGKYVDGQLVSISYIPNQADYDSIWELIRK
jgi:hypothetical protein